MKPFYCRIGNKRTLSNQITSIIPDHSIYVEPFVGGGAVFFKKPESEKEVINDLDKNLIVGYRALKNVSVASIEPYWNSLKEYPDYNEPPVKGRFRNIDIIAKKVLQFCGTFSSQGKGKIYRPRVLDIRISTIPNYKQRLKNTTILNTDYKKVIDLYDSPDTFFYLDPPYENSERLYKHAEFNYEELYNILKKIKGKFLLSLNDSPNILKIFKGFKIKHIVVKSTSNSDIGIKPRKELLISNYNLSA